MTVITNLNSYPSNNVNNQQVNNAESSEHEKAANEF